MIPAFGRPRHALRQCAGALMGVNLVVSKPWRQIWLDDDLHHCGSLTSGDGIIAEMPELGINTWRNVAKTRDSSISEMVFGQVPYRYRPAPVRPLPKRRPAPRPAQAKVAR